MTGATGTIGGALLRRLWADQAWAGVRFCLHGRDPGALRSLLAEAAALGVEAEAWPGDLCQPQGLLDRLRVQGPWAGFAFVAGTNHDDPLPRLDEAAWQRVWDVNVGVHARLMRRMAWAPGASGLLVGSIVGLRGNAGQAAYAAAKGGLVDLLRGSPPGLRLNLLLPPLVQSRLLAGLSPGARERLFKARLLDDPDPAATCAAAGAFLLSPAAGYIHRQVWHADSRVGALGMD